MEKKQNTRNAHNDNRNKPRFSNTFLNIYRFIVINLFAILVSSFLSIFVSNGLNFSFKNFQNFYFVQVFIQYPLLSIIITVLFVVLLVFGYIVDRQQEVQQKVIESITKQQFDDTTLAYTAPTTIESSGGSLPLSRQYYQQSLALLQEVGDRRGEGIALIALGDLSIRGGSVEEAISYYQRGLRIFTEIGDKREEAIAETSLANAYRQNGRLEEALSIYQRAISVFHAIRDINGEAETIGRVADIMTTQSDLDNAVELYNQSLLLFQQTGNKSGQAETLIKLGGITQQKQQDMKPRGEADLLDSRNILSQVQDAIQLLQTQNQDLQARLTVAERLLVFQQATPKRPFLTVSAEVSQVLQTIFIIIPLGAAAIYGIIRLIVQIFHG